MVEFYEDWYRNLISHSNEKDLLVAKIGDLLQGKSHTSCLEIGLGIFPYFSIKLSPLFKRYMIIEKRKYSDKLPDNVELVHGDWEKVDLNEKFDVILASHVVYYFEDLEKSLEEMFSSLNDGGRVFFVVNGKESDYGPLKLAFAEMLGKKYIFTYENLLSHLKGRKVKEYTAQSSLNFSSSEELYEILKLSFDLYPKEYEQNREKIIEYLRENVKGDKFFIDQKIIEVDK